MPVCTATGPGELLKSAAAIPRPGRSTGAAPAAPVPGGYDGDGRLDVAIYQSPPASGQC